MEKCKASTVIEAAEVCLVSRVVTDVLERQAELVNRAKAKEFGPVETTCCLANGAKSTIAENSGVLHQHGPTASIDAQPDTSSKPTDYDRHCGRDIACQ